MSRHLSASQIGDAGSCPKRLELRYRDDIVVQPRSGGRNISGSIYHAVLEDYYQQRAESGWWEPKVLDLDEMVDRAVKRVYDETVSRQELIFWEGFTSHARLDEYAERRDVPEQPPEGWQYTHIRTVEDGRTFTRLLKWDDVALEGVEIERITDTVTNMVVAYFHGVEAKGKTPEQPPAVWPAEYEVKAVELEFYSPFVPGWNKKGFIDLVLFDPATGYYIIADHKTSGRRWAKGKEHPRKNIQGPLYIMAVKELFGDVPAIVCYDVMTEGLVFERRRTEVGPEHLQAVVDRGWETAQLIDSGLALPANPDSNFCNPKFCTFWDVCPSGGALE